MKIENAIKKLVKAGFETENSGSFYYASKPDFSDVIEFTRNGSMDTVATIRVKGKKEQDEIYTDYFCGIYVDNISQAMRLAR